MQKPGSRCTVHYPVNPNSPSWNGNAGRIYCNIEDKKKWLPWTSKTTKLVNTWPIARVRGLGLAFDAANHRLFYRLQQ